MKKTIILETLLLFVFAVILYDCITNWQTIKITIEMLESTPDYLIQKTLNKQITYAIFSTFACIADFAAIIIIAIKDLPVFKQLLDKLRAQKLAKAEAEKQKAIADKQQQLEILKAELEELKKD